MAESQAIARVLVFGYGNPSRGDDALGPAVIAALEDLRADGRLTGVDLLTDFQLQIEHVLDLRDRDRVIFVDADLSPETGGRRAPWSLLPIEPAPDPGWTSHHLDPSQLAGLLSRLCTSAYPVLQLLAIRGQSAELGADLSAYAKANLAAAVSMLSDELRAESCNGEERPASPLDADAWAQRLSQSAG
jgi:hydrogenase maturation protease